MPRPTLPELTKQHFDSLKKEIESEVLKTPVMVYMRGNPHDPHCGFSARTIAILEDVGTPFESRDLDKSPEFWSALKKINDWPTSPQIFIHGKFVGGCDHLMEMWENGVLQNTLKSLN